YYRSARMLGVEVRYDSEVVALEIAHGRFTAAIVRQGERTERIEASALVAAAGGFESNLEWLRDAWGPAADNFIVRGTPYNRGAVLRALLDSGAEQVGDPTQCHAVAIDARAPKFDGGIVTRVDCVSLGIVVNRASQRFYDEGEDFWPKRYAIWGRLVAQQPDQIAYSIIDSKAIGRFMPPVFPGERAATLSELADKLSLDRPALQATIDQFNASVQPGTFDHAVLDDCATAGITPPKTHWAQRIEKPPYFGFPLRPGITFTYLGVRVDTDARIVMNDGDRSANMLAAGEIMAGNVLGQGYVAGIGMTIGTVFGRIAGASSARLAQSMQ
nr:FAD-dependent tricarballylate dehydrogenase TcuA [Burkholderiaceae bacterium]